MNNLIKITFIVFGLILSHNSSANFTDYDITLNGPESWTATGDEYAGTNFWAHHYWNFQVEQITGGRDECHFDGCENNTATHSGIDFSIHGYPNVYSHGFGEITGRTAAYGLVSIRHLVNTGQYFQVNLLHSSNIGSNVILNNYIVKNQFIGNKSGIGRLGTDVFAHHLHFEVSDSVNITAPLTANAHPGPGDLRPSVFSKGGLTAHYSSTNTNIRYYNPNDFAVEKREAIPFLSRSSVAPSALEYDVYGIANANIYGGLNLSGTFHRSSIVVRDNFRRSQIEDLGSLNDTLRFLGGINEDALVNGINGSNTYSEGNYLFAAYVNQNNEHRFGYPVKFSFVKQGDIIVDNDQQNADEVTTNDTQNKPAYNGLTGSKVPGYFLTADLHNGKSNTFAQWKPYQNGEYKIFVHIPEYGATATNVRYKIKTDANNFVLSSPINQSLHGGEWVRLITDNAQTFQLDASGYVAINLGADEGGSNFAVSADQQVAFDAVKFVQVANETSAAIRPGFNSNTLAANDDGSTGLVDLGFTMNFFGNTFSQGYVNNNGNMTFDSALSTFTPFGLSNADRVIIAPFFADVDTYVEGSSPVTYGQGVVGSRSAFAVNWVNVACFSTPEGGYNSFQMILIDRADIGTGDFDIEFNYQTIDWETGQASGGDSICEGGSPVRIGYSNGTSTSFELAGSGIAGAFLDSNAVTGLIHNNRNSLESGRYLFEVRNGDAPVGKHIAGNIFANDVSSALPSSLVQICTDGSADLQCNLTRANVLGEYIIDGLANGSYEIKAFPPVNSNFQTGSIGPVVLDGVNLDQQDIILQGPQPLPSNTVISPSTSNLSTGEPSIYWNDTLTLNTQACSGGSANYSITHNDTGSVIASGALQENSVNLGNYSVEIAPLSPNSGHVTVSIETNCPDNSREEVIFSMYIDPSGVVVDTLGNPISNATVQLFRSDSSAGPFVLVPNGSEIMSPTNRNNPDLTDERGLFGWDVITGYYTVKAEAVECTSPDDANQNFVETDVMFIPPEVTDLRLVLECELPASFEVCDVNQDGFVSRADVMLIYGDLRSEVISNTSGDITGDGVISTQDVRGCMTECTLPRCAEPTPQ